MLHPSLSSSWLLLRRTGILVALAGVATVAPIAPDAAALEPGDLVVGQSAELLRVDPATGDREVLSGAAVGSGPLIDLPGQIGFDLDGSVLLTDLDLKAVLRIDPNTGDRTIVASQSVGSGLPFRPFALDRLVLFGILVVETEGPSLVIVDPATGDRSVISSASVGSGPLIDSPFAVRVRGATSVFITDFNTRSLLEVNRLSGDRTVLSGPGVGTGPLLDDPRGLALGPLEDFFMADAALDAVVRIDSDDGSRTIVSDKSTGTGPDFDFPYDLRSEAGGSLVVVDWGLGVVRVDVATGDRSIVSDAATGLGPALTDPRAIAVVPTPRAIDGFEGDPQGLPPAGVAVAGNVFVEAVADAPEGSQVLTLSTGPGANGLGPPGIDITGDGNVEVDRGQVLLSFERRPTDPPFVSVDLAVLTGESPVEGVGHADPLSLQLDDVAPPFLVAASTHFDNGTHLAISGFSGGPQVGLDGSSFDEGQLGYAELRIPVDVGPHFFFLDVADEIDALGDTAWRVDDLRFVPEPGVLPGLAAGMGLLAALAGSDRGRRTGCRRG